MLFASLPFALFFLLVLAGARGLPPRARNGWLLLASLVFYAMWVPSYLLVLLADIGVNYALLRWMVREPRRRLPLVLSLLFTLGLLFGFKYVAFAFETAAPLLSLAPGLAPRLAALVPDVFLPLGISFYSFQILSLAMDVRRGDPAPESLGRYALFVAFFPQLVAGPILRGRELLPQLARGGETSPERTWRGLRLVAVGLTKKLLLADFLLAPFVNEVFASAGVASAPFHWLALYAFAFQIYFDFSGYTDMARGLALLLGYELPMNFLEPYLARSPAEFWRRWHATLSRWLRLYLFNPLGHGLLRRFEAHPRASLAAAQVVTMGFCGLWHGAGAGFVVWGLIHGVLLAAWPRRRGQDSGPLRWAHAPWVFATFHAVVLSLVFFRAPSLQTAVAYLDGLAGGGELGGWPVAELALVLACAALHGIERAVRVRLPAIDVAVAARPGLRLAEAAMLGTACALGIAVLGAGGAFIYFQF